MEAGMTRVVPGVYDRQDARLTGSLAEHTFQPSTFDLTRGRLIMPKVLKCGDLMPGCDAVIEGNNVDEVLKKGEEHARKAHGMTGSPSPEALAKVKAAIRDK
jgi:predicted small metal-binding protein